MSDEFDATTRDARLHRLVAEYLEAVDGGAAVDRTRWARQHPEFQDELEAFFADADEVAAQTGALQGLTADDEDRNGHQAARRIGDYELLEELGHGGMGIVFRARHVHLNRVVAIKMIRDGQFASEAERRRMQNEVEAIAALDHPRIIPVYEVGEFGGSVWFAMKSMGGGSLATRLEEFRDRPRQAAALIEAIARALDHAHQRGVLHRDLKPSNILLDEHGRAHVGDFGLARRIDATSSLTATEELIGTPPFMSPEQARRDRRSITTASDVYGLGAVLYALLTGRPPFQAESVVDVLVQVCDSQPAAPRSVNNLVPRDLETICLKALAKDPGRRYASALAMADDLRRFLDDRTILARPATRRERIVRWVRRRPSVAALLVLIVSCIGIAVLSLGLHNRSLARLNERLVDAGEQARQAQEHAEQNGRRARQLLYQADMLLATQAWRAGDVLRASQLLERHRPGPGAEDFRGFEWNYLWHLLRMNRTGLEGRSISLQGNGTSALYFVCYSPTGKVLATAGARAVVYFFDAATYQPLGTLHTGQGEVNGLAFTSDDRRLATTGDDGTVRVWNWATGDELWKAEAHDKMAYQCGFTADDARLVTCGADPVVRIWNAATGERLHEIVRHQDFVQCLAIQPDGPHMVTGSSDRSARLFSLDTHRETRQYGGHQGVVSSAAWCAANDTIATASLDGGVHVWPANHSRKGLYLAERLIDRAQSLAYRADGGLLACGDRGGVIHVWEVATSPRAKTAPAEEFSWTAHNGRVYGLAFSPDQTRLVSAGQDGQLRVWNRLSPDEFQRPLTGVDAFLPLPDRPEVVVAGEDGLFVWNPDTNTSSARLIAAGGLEEPISLAVTAGGDRLAVCRDADHVQIWNLRSEELVTEWQLPSAAAGNPTALSPDGRLLALEAEETAEQVQVLDAATGTMIASHPCINSHDVCFSPDGRLLAFDDQNVIYLWDVKTRRIAQRWRGHDATVNILCFSPDGTLLASGSDDRTLRIWDVDANAVRFTAVGHKDSVHSIAFSPDGRTLASVSYDGTVKLWHVAYDQELCQLPGPQLRGKSGILEDVGFTSDGHSLLCRSRGYDLYLYRGPPDSHR